MKHTSFPKLQPRNVEELLFHMPTVAKTASTDWARGFALSVLLQSKRRNWRPSEKQIAMMRKMVSELFTVQRGADEEFSLIEG